MSRSLNAPFLSLKSGNALSRRTFLMCAMAFWTMAVASAAVPLDLSCAAAGRAAAIASAAQAAVSSLFMALPHLLYLQPRIVAKRARGPYGLVHIRAPGAITPVITV